MKKLVSLLILTVLLTISSVAFASLDDTRASIAAQYGEYRLLIDTNNQLWTKADWEAKGWKRAKASSYMYSFRRQGLGVQMEVMYENSSPQALVRAQRITPDMPIKIKELKEYFPEVYALVVQPKAEAFATYKQLSRQFQEPQSPVSMGILLKRESDNTLLAFNIQDEGRYIQDIKYIDEDTYIREFTIEKVSQSAVYEAMKKTSAADWKIIKNYF
ncbi:MAG TPA: hypothetical protein VGL27_04160 [Negativicutes bacterium]|jgi:hypothetical protein